MPEKLNAISSFAVDVQYYPSDVRDRPSVEAVFQQIQNECGQTDVVVYAARLGGVATDQMLHHKDWNAILMIVVRNQG